MYVHSYHYTAPYVVQRVTAKDAELDCMHAELCWRMLTYADVCWRMLTYADACWRMCNAWFQKTRSWTVFMRSSWTLRCPHTCRYATIYVFSYCCICVRILYIVVYITHVYPQTALSECSQASDDRSKSEARACITLQVLSLYISSYYILLCTCAPHTTIHVSYRSKSETRYSPETMCQHTHSL